MHTFTFTYTFVYVGTFIAKIFYTEAHLLSDTLRLLLKCVLSTFYNTACCFAVTENAFIQINGTLTKCMTWSVKWPLWCSLISTHSFDPSAGLTELKATLWNKVSPSTENAEWDARFKWNSAWIQLCCCFRRIELRSLSKISEGEELTVTYVDFLNLTEERQRLLKTQYFFDCTCEHCKNHVKDDLKLAGREVDGVKVRARARVVLLILDDPWENDFMLYLTERCELSH